jgi:hypothetical protein
VTGTRSGVLVQQLKHVVEEVVLSFGKQLRLRESGLRDTGTGILAAKRGDEVVAVVLPAEVLLFQQFDNRRDLLHVRDRGFFEGHALASGAVVAHLFIGFHFRASFCASASWADVIWLASASRASAALCSPRAAARLYHMWAWTESWSTPCPSAYIQPSFAHANPSPCSAA